MRSIQVILSQTHWIQVEPKGLRREIYYRQAFKHGVLVLCPTRIFSGVVDSPEGEDEEESEGGHDQSEEEEKSEKEDEQNEEDEQPDDLVPTRQYGHPGSSILSI